MKEQRKNSKYLAFCERFHLKLPILLAPMAGACPPSLSIAVANAGGMGACGAVMLSPQEIESWVTEFRKQSSAPFQINNWIPSRAPKRDPAHEIRVREFLEKWGPPVSLEAGDQTPPCFESQWDAILEAKPAVVSSIMGLFPPKLIKQMKSIKTGKETISWFAVATTVKEAKLAEAAGADVIVAQGYEAGGHRGVFYSEGSQDSHLDLAEQRQVGLLSLIPALVDAVQIPVVASGGIADGRTAAAALILGASAVQIGTGFLRCPEAKTHPTWANALGNTAPEDTCLTRAFSGRSGRSINTAYVQAARQFTVPTPAPYPIQRGFTSAMRAEGQKNGNLDAMQAWSGQSASLARALPAQELIEQIWQDTKELLGL